MDANLIVAAAFLLGFFSAFGLGPMAGLAAGAVLTVLLDAAVGTDAEGVLRDAPTDLVSTLILLFCMGVGWLCGLGIREVAQKHAGD